MRPARRPLVLLHGIGMSRFVWNPVTRHLCSTRRVIAFDIAGFGLTLPLPRGIAPSVPNLVDGLERSIRRIGIEFPVDVAGNSLGGCMALQSSQTGIARKVVAISPIGLWTKHEPRHVQYVFRSSPTPGDKVPIRFKRDRSLSHDAPGCTRRSDLEPASDICPWTMPSKR